jgi:hypothetical protein
MAFSAAAPAVAEDSGAAGRDKKRREQVVVRAEPVIRDCVIRDQRQTGRDTWSVKVRPFGYSAALPGS